jgi:hypothetical protein
MWERFGDATKVVSWTEAWVELVPRDSGEAMRERATDTHITKEASTERKRELVRLILQDEEVRNDVHVQQALRSIVQEDNDRFRRPEPVPASDRGTSPEDWNAEQWAEFDRKVITATGDVLMAFHLWSRGDYTPSVAAIAKLSMLRPQDIDAELATLLGNG